MKYLIEASLELEIQERMKYLYEIFNVFTIRKYEKGTFIELTSLPSHIPNIFFIIGHDTKVEEYIKKNANFINEKNVVIISCRANKLKKFFNNDKNVYISYQDEEHQSKKRVGLDYGFGFDITDSELDLYNKKIKNEEELEKAFKRII